MNELHFLGKLTSDQTGRVLGPNTIGDRLVVKLHEYNPDNNTTTLYLETWRGEPDG